jgi:predicted acetyltransferase
VLPTHRRRGVLTAMMQRLLDDAVEHSEPLAILTASEGGIYGRFGFGVTSRAESWVI